MNNVLKMDEVPGSPLKPEIFLPDPKAARARAEAYLKRVSRLDHQIDQKIRLQERLREQVTKKTRAPSGLPAGSHFDYSSLSDWIIDLEQDINRDIDQLVDLKKEIDQTLAQFENQTIAAMVEKHYILGLSTRQIAKEEPLSQRQVQRLIQRGLLELDRILQENPPTQVPAGR